MNIKNLFFVFAISILLLMPLISAGDIIWSGGSRRAFETGEPDVPVCHNDPEAMETYGYSYWETDGSDIENSVNSCYRVDGKNEIGDNESTCCPPSYECNVGSGECEETNITGCEDYNTEDACRDDNSSVANSQVEEIFGSTNPGMECGGFLEKYGECSVFTDCRCRWDDNEGCKPSSSYTIVSSGGKEWSIEDLIEDGDYNDSEVASLKSDAKNECKTSGDPKVDSECQWDTEVIDNCNSTGFKEVIIDGNVVNGDDSDLPWCKDSENTVPCVSSSLLSFVGISSVIIVFILLIVFYLWFKGTKKDSQNSKHGCPQCDKTFNSSRGLKIHKGKAHK